MRHKVTEMGGIGRCKRLVQVDSGIQASATEDTSEPRESSMKTMWA